MTKSLRLSETWFNRALWLIAVIFAGFLIGLGSKIVGDLPKVEQNLSQEQFLDKPALDAAQQAQDKLRVAAGAADQQVQDAQSAQLKAQTRTQDAQASFNNWLATRSATQQSGQNAALIERTQALDALKAAERQAGEQLAQRQAALQAAQAQLNQAGQAKETLKTAAQHLLNEERKRQDLRVFLYRLALTLPLLLIAGWLFVKQRKSTYWPFVWGFIFFALFAFFVELVPYLPSYGGYVRYGVGVVLTAVIGRQIIVSLNRYLAQQKATESLPDAARRETLSEEVALQRMAKSICPSCERPADLKNPERDFCGHCGISHFKRCTACNTRKNAFEKYCHRCGVVA